VARDNLNGVSDGGNARFKKRCKKKNQTDSIRQLIGNGELNSTRLGISMLTGHIVKPKILQKIKISGHMMYNVLKKAYVSTPFTLRISDTFTKISDHTIVDYLSFVCNEKFA
jgi:hypothetical protein